MSVLQNISDGLVNLVANLNTRRDKQSSSEYVDQHFSSYELLTMYRNSWLARAIVDYPAEDATRKWRLWRADSEQISKIEAEEKRLNLKSKVQEAKVAARLYGGAAIYINTPETSQDTPLKTTSKVDSLVILTRDDIKPKEIVKDINSPYYRKAEIYTLVTGDKSSRVEIHASRLVIFPGNDIPGNEYNSDRIWGDSVIQSAYDAMLQTDNTMANIASLVFEAKVDVFKFAGFAEMMERNKDSDVIRRMTLNAAMKGNNGSVVIDAQDSYEQKNASFSGLTDIAGKFQENFAGSARIPVTRLYGRSSVGLSGSGEGDERVYYDRIGHEQSTRMGPAMSLLDECVINNALGGRPPEIFYEWAPLRQLTETERSKIFGETASAARAIAGNNIGEIIPIDALSKSLTNELIELGVLPGLEGIIEEYGTLKEQNSFTGGEE